MQMPPERILTEERLNDLGSAFADCVKESFKDTLPKAKITVYMRTPKYDDKGNMSSAFRYDISDDTVDEETLKEQTDYQREPLRQCFLDKVSQNKDRDPGRNWVGYFGHVLSLEMQDGSESDKELTELHSLDESQWIEVIKFAQQKNRYSKIEIVRGRVVDAAWALTPSVFFELIKFLLSDGDQQLIYLMEKIKDLPVEEISKVLEEIRKNIDGFLL